MTGLAALGRGFFGLLFLFYGVSPHAEPAEVSIPTADGFTLKGDLFLGYANMPGILLFHQCSVPAQMNRKSLSSLAAKLNAAGFTVLSVDFRGFGGSISEDFNLSTLEGAAVFQKRGQAFAHFVSDAGSAFGFLQNVEGVEQNRLAIFGASCGGAMALRIALEEQSVKAVVLLSPFLGEPWIKEEQWQALEKSPLSVLAIAATGDTGNGIFDNAGKAANLSSGPNEFLEYEGHAHGVPLFVQDPNLEGKIVSWLINRMPGNLEE